MKINLIFRCSCLLIINNKYIFDFFQASDSGIIVLDATLDASTTDDSDWEISGGPPSPCDVSFLNDNILINGRSNLSKSPRNHKVSNHIKHINFISFHSPFY